MFCTFDMKNFNEYLNESILDLEQANYSSDIFDISTDDIKLKDSVREQILTGIGILSKYMRIVDYTLIGSILTKRYTPDSDIDINILISAPDDEMEQLISMSGQLSGKVVKDTHHPINYHILNDKMDFDNANNSADGVFDISKNIFIRKALEKPFYIEDYMSKFKSLVAKIDMLSDNLEDDLMDYSELETIPKLDIQNMQQILQQELLEIENDVKTLVSIYQKVKDDRADVFAKQMTPKQIAIFGVKNRLPQNVIYKLLERHHYLDFLAKLKTILGHDKTITQNKIPKLKKLIDSNI